MVAESEARAGSQKAAEADVARFHDQLGPFVTAAESTRMPMVFTNALEPDNPVVFVNDSFLKLTGYERAEVMGQSFNDLMTRGADADVRAKVDDEFHGKTNGTSAIEYRRKDGGTVWIGLFVSPVRDAEGALIQHFASFHDLTRHHDAQAQSRMLIGELNHRVKNTLATVQAIVSQGLRGTSDTAAARQAIESRLMALSRSHDLLTRGSWSSTGLHDIVLDALQPFGIANGREERFTVKGENIRFPPKAVLALSIALHELATNAVKYGAFSNNVGRVLIKWSTAPSTAGDRMILQWRETDGPPVTPPARAGFGSLMIKRGLAHELNGVVDLDFQPDGLMCTIDMLLP